MTSTKGLKTWEIGQHIATTRAALKEQPLTHEAAPDYIAGFCAADDREVERGSVDEALIVFAYFDAEVQSGRWGGMTLAGLQETAAEWHSIEAKRSLASREF